MLAVKTDSRSGKGLTVTHFVESCVCPQCQQTIPRGNFKRHIPRTGPGPTERVTRAWCDFCCELFRERQTLEGGLWTAAEGHEVVHDRRERDAFVRGLEAVNGDRRIVPVEG